MMPFSSIVDLLRDTVFNNKLESGNARTFVAGIDWGDSLNDRGNGALGLLKDFALIPLEPMFWVQLVALILLESTLNVALAYVIYHFIIVPQQQRQQQEKDAAASFALTSSPYVIGYGLICPFLMYVPFAICDALRIQNMVIMMVTAAAPSVLFFRTLEAMHGTVPPFATGHGPRRYALYFAATVQFRFCDEKSPAACDAAAAQDRAEANSDAGRHHEDAVVRVTKKMLLGKVWNLAKLYVETSLLFSLLIPHNFAFFGRRDNRGDALSAFLDLFYWGNILNNLLLAHLTSICLEYASDGMGLVTSLVSGYDTLQLNDAPLTKSASPSEFWGRRWNVVISSALKRAVFKPVRKAGFSRPVAAMATFVASGLFHEYLIFLMISVSANAKASGTWSPRLEDENPTQPSFFGKHLLFFVWNALVLSIDPILRNTKPIRYISRTFPAPVKTFLVLLTVIPVAHLFTDVYVDMGFYSDFAVGFPLLVRRRGR